MIIQIVYTHHNTESPQHHNTESQSHNTESHINIKEKTYIQEILPYIGIIYIYILAIGYRLIYIISGVAAFICRARCICSFVEL